MNTSIAMILKAIQIALFALICFFGVKALMVWMNPETVWTIPEKSPAAIGAAANPAAQTKALDFSFDPFHREKRLKRH